MKIRIIPVTPFSQNCSLLICETTKKAALVDPGGDIDLIFDVIKEESITVEKILLTHGHLDHCGASKQIRDQLNITIEGPHKDDQFWIDQLEEQSKQFGLPNASSFIPDRYLNDNEIVEFGTIKLLVKHCPGAYAWACYFLFTRRKNCDCRRCAFQWVHWTNRLPKRGLRHTHRSHHNQNVALR